MWNLVNYHLNSYAWMLGYWAYLIFYRQWESYYWLSHGNISDNKTFSNITATYQVLVDTDVYLSPNIQLLVLLKKGRERERERKFICGKITLYTSITSFNELNNIKLSTGYLKFSQLSPSLRNKVSWSFLLCLLKTMFTGSSLIICWCGVKKACTFAI